MTRVILARNRATSNLIALIRQFSAEMQLLRFSKSSIAPGDSARTLCVEQNSGRMRREQILYNF